MNLVDLILALLVVAAASTGWRLGLAARALSWVGGITGLVFSFLLVRLLLGAWTGGSSITRLLVGLGVVLVVTSVLAGLGEVAGLRVRRRVEATSFNLLDRVAGLAAGATSVLVLLWLFLPTLATTPGILAREVRQSNVVQWLDRTAPEAPDPAHALRRLVDRSGFPDVFADLRPAPVTGPPPSQVPVPAATVEAVTTSTFKVEAMGCSNGFEGSAFVVAEDLVVTNAHVVAGATEVQLRRTDGSSVTAQVRHVDEQRDLALLDAPGLGRAPLAIRDPEIGEEAASIGYPGGQDTPRVAPAIVQDARTAVGRDIHGRGLATREVLYLSANLARGDSGSPLVGTDGAVIGVIFAISPDDPDTAYALHIDELEAVLEASPNRDSGACLA